MQITRILLLAITVIVTCSCSGIKNRLRKEDKTGSITEINCNKISKIESMQVLGQKVDDLLNGEYYRVHGNKTLELDLAEDGYTRILFEDEIITDIFFYPEDALQASIHNSGYLIVMSLVGKLPVQVTITTRNGITQDLMLNFTKKKPQPVILVKGGQNAK